MNTAKTICWTRPAPRGSVALLTLIFLALFASLALAFFAASDLSLCEAHNGSIVQSAQTVAESGLSYLATELGEQSIPVADANTDLLLATFNATKAALDYTNGMGANGVTLNGNTITIPSITTANGGTFSATIIDPNVPIDPNDPNGPKKPLLKLSVTASSQGLVRRVSMDLQKVPGSRGVFDYGIASKGSIVIGGNGKVLGVNNPHEADIMSATFDIPTAVSITGSAQLDGDIATANPKAVVYISGSPTIAGSSNPATFPNHIRLGAGTTDFPAIDTNIYTPFIQNKLPANTKLKSGMTLDNTEIPAGMNPTFNNVTIRGVLYIDQPNQVTFAGGANIQGVIVTQNPNIVGSYATDTISFSGNVTSQGVETLPDTSGASVFTGVKALPGSMLLAPGFGVLFSGSFTAINGAIACDDFTMTGDAGGTIYGPIICYGDTQLKLWGSALAKIDRSKYTGVLPGFDMPVRLAPVGSSYIEG